MHKFLFYNKFIIFLYMFRALLCYQQEVKTVLYSIWYRHTCRWPSGAQVERGLRESSLNLRTGRPPTVNVKLAVHIVTTVRDCTYSDHWALNV